MSVTEQNLTGMEALKKLPEGLYAAGEFRGIEERDSNGKMYYKLKVLLGDKVKKFDVKPDQYLKYKSFVHASRIVVRYYEFDGKFGMNYVCTDVMA